MSVVVGDVILAVSEATELAFRDFNSYLDLQKITVELLTEVTQGAESNFEYKLLKAINLSGKAGISKKDVSTLTLELTRRAEAKTEAIPKLTIGVEKAVEGIRSALKALVTDRQFRFKLDKATIDLKFTVKKEGAADFLVVGVSGSEEMTHHLILEVYEASEEPQEESQLF